MESTSTGPATTRFPEWLRLMGLFRLTTHEDRVEIDREIERRTEVYCDDAIDGGLISKQEFDEMVDSILRHKKKRIKERPMVV